MRRVSKGKRGKSSVNKVGKDHDVESSHSDVQDDNRSQDASEEENLSEVKKTPGKTSKRGRKSTGPKIDQTDDTSEAKDDAPLNGRYKKIKTKTTDTKLGHDSDDNKHTTEKEAEENYEVEEVTGSRIIGGKKQYKIKWKGYDEETWEHENDLNCPDLVKDFLSQHPDAVEETAKSGGKSSKKNKNQSNVSTHKAKKQRLVEPVSEDDGNLVYEVERVVEVHYKKNGEREFLIRWKGFGAEDDTWEPEANLNCRELIDKFMEKVKKAKEVSVRELRANPQVTKRFTLYTTEKGRRLSHRNASKQRATYYNAE